LPASHKSTTYKPVQVHNPFLAGQDKAYGELFDNERKRSMFYLRVFGLGSLGLFIASLALFFYGLSLQKTIPVLVNVLPSGEASYLGEVKDSGSFNVPEAAIFYQVRKFINNLRFIPVDSQVLYNNITECYSMVTSTYAPIMTRMLTANSPFPLVGKVRRSIEIESTLRITGSSYQVDWVEITTEQGGRSSNVKMRGLITVKLITPEPSFIRDNPLGIFIEACEWTQL